MSEQGTRAPARWDPFSDLDWFRSPLGRSERHGAPASGAGFPAVDVAEDDEQYVVTAELPGTRSEDVSVEIHEGVLTLRGEKRNEREERNEHRCYLERSYGTFSRAFSLPPNADAGNVKARFEDGVLTITVRKTGEAKPRTVAIKS